MMVDLDTQFETLETLLSGEWDNEMHDQAKAQFFYIADLLHAEGNNGWILRSEREPMEYQWIILDNEKILGNNLPAFIGEQYLPRQPEKMYFPNFTKWKPL